MESGEKEIHRDECCGPDPSHATAKARAEHKNDGHHDHDHDHEIELGDVRIPEWKKNWNLLLSLSILIIVLILEFGFHYEFPKPYGLLINVTAFLLAGWGVMKIALRRLKRADIFNEFVLMSVATIGAFLIGEYTEGVAVMVFYSIGEWFQDSAVQRARRSIKALLDIRPDRVTVIRQGKAEVVDPLGVRLNERIQIKPGDKVALDGELISETASFNTAVLTGESKPDVKYKGEQIFAGMINLNTLAEVKVTALFKDSKLSRILEMVQESTARKSQTQLFISRFAKIYTPVVFFLALAVVTVPYFFDNDYAFNNWLYRGLVFLVISCPCALVVSIPLGYFGGIGLASRHGVLFKGGNFLDVMTKIDTVVMDKTGTLTKGVFRVQQVQPASGFNKEEFVRLASALERNSTHPVGKAIVEYAGETLTHSSIANLEEIPGHGIKGVVDGYEVMAGNTKLLKRFKIEYPAELENESDTIVLVSIAGTYAGHITIADEIKDDSVQAVRELHGLHIKTVMLSGDKQSVVNKIAKQIGIDEAYGDLLPAEKVEKVSNLKDGGRHIAFVGDGVNDAPVVALADAGIAMGKLGSDATIETADVVIQNDQPTGIVSAIKIGNLTKTIVWQNVILALAVKAIVLILGAGGLANLWEAVFADVGVALLAILNAIRIQKMKI